MFCKYCGKELKDDAEFCPYCGKKQTADDTEEHTVTNKNVSRAQNVSVNVTETEKENKAKTASSNDKETLLTKQSSSARKSSSRRGVFIAAGLVVVIVIVAIVGVTRNTGSASRGGSTSDNTVAAGEGGTITNNANASQNGLSYSEQIDIIMQNFEYFVENEYGESVNASYRMFELLCVMAEEFDQSGTYAKAEAESAMEVYKETDATLEYGNLQIANGLYRCVEMLSAILYEVEGEGSLQWINDTLNNSITEAVNVPTEDNFLECQGEAMYVMYEYLYRLVQNFDLPEENRKEIDADYADWTEDMNTVKNEKDKAAYNYGQRQMLGSLYRVYQLLYQTASGLDSSGKYSENIQLANEDFKEGLETWKDSISTGSTLYLEEDDTHFQATMYNDSTRLLAVIAWLFS